MPTPASWTREKLLLLVKRIGKWSTKCHIFLVITAAAWEKNHSSVTGQRAEESLLTMQNQKRLKDIFNRWLKDKDLNVMQVKFTVVKKYTQKIQKYTQLLFKGWTHNNGATAEKLPPLIVILVNGDKKTGCSYWSASLTLLSCTSFYKQLPLNYQTRRLLHL